MKPEKVKMEDILKPGKKLTAFTIKDTSEVREQIRETVERQKKILKQKDVDMNQLKNTYITI